MLHCLTPYDYSKIRYKRDQNNKLSFHSFQFTSTPPSSAATATDQPLPTHVSVNVVDVKQ